MKRRTVRALALAVLLSGLATAPVQAAPGQASITVGRAFYAGSATSWTINPVQALLDSPSNQVPESALRGASLVEVSVNGAVVPFSGDVILRPGDANRFFQWRDADNQAIAFLTLTARSLDTPTAPVAAPDEYWVQVGEGLDFELLGNDASKPRGFTVDTSVPYVSEPRPDWQFPSVVLSNTATAAGTLSAADGGMGTSFDYARLSYIAGDTPGTDTFHYESCHGHVATSCSALTPVTIHVVPKVAAVTDTAQVAPGGSVTVDVLANDTYSANPRVYVQDGWGPAGGATVVNANRTVTVTVPASAAGTTINVPYRLFDAGTHDINGALGTIKVKVTGEKVGPPKPHVVEAKRDRFTATLFPPGAFTPIYNAGARFNVLRNDIVTGPGPITVTVAAKSVTRGARVQVTDRNQILVIAPKKFKGNKVTFTYEVTNGGKTDTARAVVKLTRVRR